MFLSAIILWSHVVTSEKNKKRRKAEHSRSSLHHSKSLSITINFGGPSFPSHLRFFFSHTAYIPVLVNLSPTLRFFFNRIFSMSKRHFIFFIIKSHSNNFSNPFSINLHVFGSTFIYIFLIFAIPKCLTRM